MARCAKTIGRERVTQVAELRLGRPRCVDDLGTEVRGAEARIVVGLLAAKVMVDVERGDLVAELAHGVPERRRVRSAGNEAGDRTAGLDQSVAADVFLDAGAEALDVHGGIVATAEPPALTLAR